jgi:transcriptional regulator with XRE-family HTH domain
MLAELLQKKIEAEGLTYREAAEEIGAAHSTLQRALRGGTMSVENLLRMCDWLQLPVEVVLDIREKPDRILDQIVTVLAISPELSDVFADIAEGVSEGTVDKSVLAEVAAFAAYRLEQSRQGSTVREQRVDQELQED